MLLNRVEYALMNNPIRAAAQRYFEAQRLLRMGGPREGASALEIGCGRGVGIELILDVFRAGSVDAFDLDPRMVQIARHRFRSRPATVRIWVGDASAISAPSARYDAVFDFGIIHHVPHWRSVLEEVRRVLKPGGRFYAEEVFGRFISNRVWRRILRHPQTDRFGYEEFTAALSQSGLSPVDSNQLWKAFGWFVADKIATD
jgi:ubiquinone/menaquinone biosynthesis C-methylase UbiE